MEWWYYGPIIVAIVMFLLVGTICQRRIETAIRRFIDCRRALLAENQASRSIDATCSTTNFSQPTSNSATPVNASSQRTLRACKTDTSLAPNNGKKPQSQTLSGTLLGSLNRRPTQVLNLQKD
ncbi:hypothetical protein evm_000168 [Chilo suppressalis]|nr:hypothetical protein evm_000168 [Chilo suppressalis]